MDQVLSGVQYPAGLLEWAGHRSGGVRRLFHLDSGRPTGAVIRTPLLALLETWTEQLAVDKRTAPRIVLLVGGPGNGKTEAVEFTIRKLDETLGLSGSLVSTMQTQFLELGDQPAPRLAKADLSKLSGGKLQFSLDIVQDASSTEIDEPSLTPASLLVRDLERLLKAQPDDVYLACINRGILDDALIVATDGRREVAQTLLERIVLAVGMAPDSPPCWPLSGYPSVAVWPMDVETLVGDGNRDGASAATQLLTIATNESSWPSSGACAAGDRCPFCTSKALLSGEPHRSSLLTILRWYELASGKRWSFRDLFSLVSFLLAGVPADDAVAAYNPCDWAAQLCDLSERATGKDSLRHSAPFVLVASQYQHALFGRWPRVGIRSLRKDISDLKLQENGTLMGLYHFLASSRGRSVPHTLEGQLAGLSNIIDPSVADPDLKVEVSSKTTIAFREVDTRFSQSVGEGLQYIQKYRCLTKLEVDLLRRLDSADQLLSGIDVVGPRPAVAARVQALVRDFACRLVRRSIGVRAAVVRDASILADFQSVVRGDAQLLHDAVKQVESLLNEKERFVLTLNTTFGEPLPPIERRAVLTTSKQRVKAREQSISGRPRAAVQFLAVGAGATVQSIPLTYELFKSVRELRKGMMPASLPRTVVALLDTIRAKLAGHVVRDDELLEASEITIGVRNEVIVRELGSFLVRRGDPE